MTELTLSVFAAFVSITSLIVSSIMYRSEIKNKNFSDSNTFFLEFDKVMIEYPKARPYIYEGKELDDSVSTEEKDRIIAIAELMLDTAEWIVDRKRGLTRENEAAQRAYVVSCLHNSKIVLQHISENPEWHPQVAQIAREEKLIERAE